MNLVISSLVAYKLSIKESKLPPDFEPQFHRILEQGHNHSVWIALPHPRTLIPLKKIFYRKWQLEECLKLQAAGETVVVSENNDR
ncbi:MAG TPA: hypothetical protein VIF82_09975 [Burkholderiaceae bacterium]